MKATQVGQCCGSIVIYDFGGTGCTNGRGSPYSKVEVKKSLDDYSAAYRGKAFIQIVLNESQVDLYHDTIVECGFEAVHKGYNLNHDHTLTMYLKINKG